MDIRRDEEEIYQFILDGKISFPMTLKSNITSSSIRELLNNKIELKNIKTYQFLDNHGNPIDKKDEKDYGLTNIVIVVNNQKAIQIKSEKLEKSENNIIINSKNNFNNINKEKSIQNKNSEDNNNKLTKEEILKAKENGFILIGKTGVGKISLLNLIYGNNVGKVGYSINSEIKYLQNIILKIQLEKILYIFAL